MRSFKWKRDLIFFVFQIILNKKLPPVYSSNFRIKCLLTSSFLGQKGNRTTSVFLSSKSQVGIMSSSSAWVGDRKSRTTASTKFFGTSLYILDGCMVFNPGSHHRFLHSMNLPHCSIHGPTRTGKHHPSNLCAIHAGLAL